MPDTLTPGKDPELVRILQEMLDANETITFRGVARRHPHIRQASSFCRNRERAALVKECQEQQSQMRLWLKRQQKQSRSSTASDLAEKERRIAELEGQLEVLQASHIAMIQIVGELGGLSRWIEIFGRYDSVRKSLTQLGVLPAGT
jgi:hypothetical protein